MNCGKISPLDSKPDNVSPAACWVERVGTYSELHHVNQCQACMDLS